MNKMLAHVDSYSQVRINLTKYEAEELEKNGLTKGLIRRTSYL